MTTIIYEGKCLTNKALLHEDVWGSGCINPRFLGLGNSLKELHVPVALPSGKIALGNHWTGGWVGPRTGLGDMEK
jgi:hypothetical protein